MQFPSNLEGWLRTVLVVAAASVILSSVARRVPAVGQVLAGF